MTLLPLLLLLLAKLLAAADTTAWKSRTIYFALTDRIAQTVSGNGDNACGDLGNYCGGSFKGLERKLDYISGMGFDAIWITPVIANKPGGYHGYWAEDLYKINPEYGTADDLKDLVDAAHERDMFVMVDVVANHMGAGPVSSNKPSPLDRESSYHASCGIDYANQSSVEQCWLSNLPDIYTEKDEIRNLYQIWIKWLITEFSFDGIRIDTVKHVEKDFWPGFIDAAGVYAIGEVWDSSPSYLAVYADVMPGLLNYAVYYPIRDFYQQRGSAAAIVNMHAQIDEEFADPSALGTFSDNHDNERWLAQKDDQVLLKNALAYVILARGIPIVYYGTEQGFAGGKDPQNREDLWRSGYDTDADLYRTIARLSKARTDAGGLPENDHVHLYATDSAYAWSRAGGDLIVLTTNTGTGVGGSREYCFNSRRPNGQWSDIFTGGNHISEEDGNICVTVSDGEPVVLSASSTHVPIATSTALTAPTQTACPTSVLVTFNHRVRTAFGDKIKIVGASKELGMWQPSDAPALSALAYTEEYPIWTCEVALPAGQDIRYKFINERKDGKTKWESGPDRTYNMPACQPSASVDSEWRVVGGEDQDALQ